MVVSKYNGVFYYQPISLHPQSPNANIYPSYKWSEKFKLKEDFLYDHFDIPDDESGNDPNIRRLMEFTREI